MALKTHSNDHGLDQLDQTVNPARDAVHFRRIVTARETLDHAERELVEAVEAARRAGDSWTTIGAALDITRQGAQQRFGRTWPAPNQTEHHTAPERSSS